MFGGGNSDRRSNSDSNTDSKSRHDRTVQDGSRLGNLGS